MKVFTEFPAGSPGLEPREECGLSKFFNGEELIQSISESRIRQEFGQKRYCRIDNPDDK
jgi:hypothetical protein